MQRADSPIIGLKNFNNWVKSVLITRFAHPVLSKSPNKGASSTRGGPNGKVLDMGCGKGGDMTKWGKARVKEYYGVGAQPLTSLTATNSLLCRHRSQFG